MKVDRNSLLKMAHLARLEIKEEEEASMMEDMNEILTWVEQLNEVDTEGVEPLTNMSHEVNVLREDEVKDHLDHDKALLNAPKKDKEFFRVPKFLN